MSCNFCGIPIYIKTIQYTKPIMAPLTRAEELKHELINLTGEVYIMVDSNFCPVCGAKMVKEDK